jgi:(2Fe-2S) ferredoxin
MSSYYKHHIFICTNLRDNGKRCCQQANASEFCHYIKQQLKKLQLDYNNIRVTVTGCMGRCTEGPVLAIYPEAVWYNYQDQTDIDEILMTHLQLGSRVTRLLLPDTTVNRN